MVWYIHKKKKSCFFLYFFTDRDVGVPFIKQIFKLNTWRHVSNISLFHLIQPLKHFYSAKHGPWHQEVYNLAGKEEILCSALQVLPQKCGITGKEHSPQMKGLISGAVTLGAIGKHLVGQPYTANSYVNVVIKAYAKKWWWPCTWLGKKRKLNPTEEYKNGK